MLRITKAGNGEVVFRLSGRMDAENVGELERLAASKRRTAALSFWTRSAIFRWNCRRNCYAYCKRENSRDSAATRPSA